MSNIEDAHEVIILFRNKTTGQESWIKLEDTKDVEFERELHFNEFDPIELYGGAVKYHPNPYVTGLDFTIKGKARVYSLALDTTKYHYDKGNQVGNQP